EQEAAMDLSDLQIFRAVANEGGVTRAAEKLNRVQSNITTRVRQLEEDLGVELFVREGKKIFPSPAGKLLLEYADRLLDLAQEARDAIQDAEPRGMLTLGAMESTAAIRLPAPLHEFHQRYPQVRLELRTSETIGLSSGVLSGELDAALVCEPTPENAFEKVMIYDEELVLVTPPGQKPIRSAGDLASQTLLAFEAGCPYRARLERWFALSGSMPAKVIDMSSWHAILGCTAAGMGISMLPRIVLASFPETKYLGVHTLPPALAHAPTMLIWRKGSNAPNVRALREVLLADVTAKAKAAVKKVKVSA
ncbi:MAG TPA: LysR substrate-binding domain-containing protein, partial [Xanthobacteraceae bacterium]|nr:LysR substrate-binding domain-containing protein [Xanthobacteraceae bacterium]